MPSRFYICFGQIKKPLAPAKGQAATTVKGGRVVLVKLKA